MFVRALTVSARRSVKRVNRSKKMLWYALKKKRRRRRVLSAEQRARQRAAIDLRVYGQDSGTETNET